MRILLEVAASAHVKERISVLDSTLTGFKRYPAMDGWKVEVYYSLGRYRWIRHFINPSGSVIDYWPWPLCRERELLRWWRPHHDIEELLED